MVSDVSVGIIPKMKMKSELAGRKMLCWMGKSFIMKVDLLLVLSFFRNRVCKRKENAVLSKEEMFLMKPKVDFCFKELMEDAEIRRGFISALLDVEPEDIERTELLPTYLRKEHEEDKQGILDVRVFVCGRTKGEWGSLKGGSREKVCQMDVEIQLAAFPLWPERSVFYLAKMV